jgi:L-idonate 5-dehydrogenase
MLACVIHGARDLRIEERASPPLGPGQVRVRLGAGGICGSDLHYYQDGRIGDARVVEPMVLGHEMAGEVVEAAADAGLAPGTRVAVNPQRPCGLCATCLMGQGHHCPQVRFAGSARSRPHSQGLFEELTIVAAVQCRPVPTGLPYAVAAMAEPLAVCLHAVNRAGPLLGRRVLVTGAGPIGCLTAIAARFAGAGSIIVTDLVAAPLAVARAVGADDTVELGADRRLLDRLQAGPGAIDVAFECSGSAKGLADAVLALRPGGVLVQVGILPGGGQPVPVDRVIVKELELRGTFRFNTEFDDAVALLAGARIDVAPLLSAELPLRAAVDAFELAADRSRAMKVHLVPG